MFCFSSRSLCLVHAPLWSSRLLEGNQAAPFFPLFVLPSITCTQSSSAKCKLCLMLDLVFTVAPSLNLEMIDQNLCGLKQLGLPGVSLYLCVVSPHGHSSMAASLELDFLHGSSGLPQERERTHAEGMLLFSNLASEISWSLCQFIRSMSLGSGHIASQSYGPGSGVTAPPCY